MSGGPPKTGLAIGGLLALIAVDRFTWYGVKAVLFILLTADAERNSMGLSREAADAFYNWAAFWSWLAIPIMGGIACLFGVRRTMLAAALLAPIAGTWVARSNTDNILNAMILLALAHGGLAVTIYTLAGRLVESTRLRWALFCALTMAINLGAFAGPLIGALGLPDVRASLQMTAILSILGVVLASFVFFVTRDARPVREAIQLGRVGELCLYSLAAACLWAVISVATFWARDSLSPPVGLHLTGVVAFPATMVLMGFLFATRTRSRPWLTERRGVTAALVVVASGCLTLPLVINGPATLVATIMLFLAWGAAEGLLTAGISGVSGLTRSRWAPAFVGIYLAASMSGGRFGGFFEFSTPVWLGLILLTLAVAAGVGFGLRALHRNPPLPEST